MNNAEFKIECFRNGLYSPEQLIEFYKRLYSEDTKYNKRDAQLWMNGKSSTTYIIDQTAIEMISLLNRIRKELIESECERIKKGQPKYTMLYKSEVDLWTEHKELFNLPLNFYNSILVELKISHLDYYENDTAQENLEKNNIS